MQRLQLTADVPESSANKRVARLAIRQLVSADEPEMSRLFQQLDEQARLDRFGHDMDDAAFEAYAHCSLVTSPAIFGAAIDDGLTGVAEITHFAPDGAAVLAFAVDAAWRRQGIGCRLLLAALAWAADQGTTSVQLQCTRSNWAVRQIAQKANARISLTSGQFLAEFDARTRIALAPGGAR